MTSVAMVMTAVSCDPEQTPSLSFGKAQYVMLEDAPLTVEVITNLAPSADLTVNLEFTGNAVKGTDYTVYSESVTIAAGQLKGSVVLTPADNYEAGKSIIISMILPVGYEAGKNTDATVSVDAKENLVYSFAVAQANVVDRYVVKLELSGEVSGDDWMATADMEIPYKLDPSVLDDKLVVDGDAFMLKKGSNVATLVVKAGEIEDEPVDFVLSVDELAAGSRYSSGDNESVTLTVSGLMKISSLLGTWEFSDLVGGMESYEVMYDPSETGEELDVLPIDNEGFKLTFYESQDEDGNLVYKLKPEGTGDWNDYFRDAVIDYSEPINYDEDAEITGPYSAIEYNTIPCSTDYEEEPMVYFSLDKVNRVFSPTVESIGKGAISMWLDSDGNLVVNLKDYDEPPFCAFWWMELPEDTSDVGYGDLFAEMFSFPSRFTKVQP